MGPGPAPQDAQAFIAVLDVVDLARYRIVGTYTRYDETVRNALQDARQKILAGFEPPGRKRENHLIWAAPGTGKTYFVQQVAASLTDRMRYHEVNLAKCTEPEFRAALGQLDEGQACLCLIDECDAKPQEPWPYEVLLPYLDAAVERGARFVFVLAGSSGTSLEDIKQRIAARPKGTDLLSRIPTGHEHVIGPMSLGDRLLIVLSQLRQAGQETGRDVRAIEKLGLYYVALNPRLANARQLREFAVRAVERVPKTDDRVKYDHLFVPGDPENKTFWAQASPVAERLVNAFVVLAGDRVTIAATAATSTPSPDGAAVAPPVAAGDARPRTNLPRQLTSFVGREREIEEVKRLLPTTVLLTLHGPGGCGKTRLAFRVAADLVDQYPHGVWVAELAPLSDPGLVPATVAAALEVQEQPGHSLIETLQNFMRRKSPLLVMDNCEHLVSACAELANALLRACPTLRILATSREPLGIPGEVVWDVPSLSVPEPSRVAPLEHLTRFDAVRLFVERAVATRPGFALTTDNAAAVTQVCSQLEGIPLAIELAAARVNVLTAEQIAARLNDRFRLLVGGSRTVLPRHQALRATMDWSYGLLSEQERRVLRRLSVFAGGWTVDAAEHVCAGGAVEPPDILDTLTRLVDKSLVIFEHWREPPHYRLLEVVRQYGWERLSAAAEVAEARASHLAWFLALAEQADAALGGPEQNRWLARLETEHDNLRTALEWCATDSSRAELGLRLAGALGGFWETRAHFSEGRARLETMLSLGHDAGPDLRAKVLYAMGALRRSLGEYEQAAAALEESRGLSQAVGDTRGVARSLYVLGFIALYQGDLEKTTRLLEESLGMFRQSKDRHGIAAALDKLARTAMRRGDYERGRALASESLTLARALQDTHGVALALNCLSLLALHEGNIEQSREFEEESLALAQQLGDREDIADSLSILGNGAIYQSDYERATALIEKSLMIAREIGYRRGVAIQLLLLGTIASATKDDSRASVFLRESLALFRDLREKGWVPSCLEAIAGLATRHSGRRAARLFGAAASARETYGLTLHPSDRDRRDGDMVTVRTQLSEAAFAAAWAGGRAMTLEQAVEYALAEPPSEENGA
ncbi:MAG TPA: tetratricopeptide repeat protein [bacterium]|nr:tetratricopeptide repeat protein [bacterium]